MLSSLDEGDFDKIMLAIEMEPQYQGITAEAVPRNIPRGLCTHPDDPAWLPCRYCHRQGRRLKIPTEMGVTQHFLQSRHNPIEPAEPRPRSSMWSAQQTATGASRRQNPHKMPRPAGASKRHPLQRKDSSCGLSTCRKWPTDTAEWKPPTSVTFFRQQPEPGFMTTTFPHHVPHIFVVVVHDAFRAVHVWLHGGLVQNAAPQTTWYPQQLRLEPALVWGFPIPERLNALTEGHRPFRPDASSGATTAAATAAPAIPATSANQAKERVPAASGQAPAQDQTMRGGSRPGGNPN